MYIFTSRNKIFNITVNLFDLSQVSKTLVETNFNLAKTVDKAAEISVQKGYLKSKDSAKRALRQAFEKARKDQNLIEKAYRMLGI